MMVYEREIDKTTVPRGQFRIVMPDFQAFEPTFLVEVLYCMTMLELIELLTKTRSGVGGNC